jgi:transposase
MTRQSRRKFSASFKAKVAMEAIKNEKTLAELSKQFEVNAVVISRWKAELLENISSVFEKSSNASKEEEVDIEKLYAQIGQLKVENDFLKKKLQETGDMKQQQGLLEVGHQKLSIRKQCDLLQVSRGSFYYVHGILSAGSWI